MGVTRATVSGWEQMKHTPQTRDIPKIVAFLGYVPEFMTAQSFAKQVRCARMLKGMTQRQFAALLGVDPSTIYQWEKGKSVPSRKLRAVANPFLNAHSMDRFHEPQRE